MLNRSLVKLIQFYKKYLSPYKGFRCAYGAYHQGDSCSTRVKKIIQRDGIFKGYQKIRLQFKECQAAYHAIQRDPRRRDKKDRWCNRCDALDCLGDSIDFCNW